MTQNQVVGKVKNFVKKRLSADSTGHDWWHIERVHRQALKIAQGEKGKKDLFVIQLGALLHDVADWKFHGGTTKKGSAIARRLLQKYHVDHITIDHVTHIIDEISFKGAGVKNKIKTIEGKIVQDADRLDALGAIGIARAFAYGGYKRRSLYDPHEVVALHKTFSAYKKGAASTLNHFYEKLLLLKDKMNTKTGKRLARERHRYVQDYLKRFLAEWKGQK